MYSVFSNFNLSISRSALPMRRVLKAVYYAASCLKGLRSSLAGNYSLLLILVLFSSPTWGEEKIASQLLPLIVVEGTPIEKPATTILQREENTRGLFTDGGDLLKTFPGISAGRMGGHGIEPVIRGQSQNRLNILLDGAIVHGGCPNRMDPPTSYGALETYDQVIVIKGIRSVSHGGGGSGGTVLFQRRAPIFAENDWLQGRAGTGYRGNQNVKEASLDIATGGLNGFVRGIVNYSDGENYKDGDGNEVRAAYTEKVGMLMLGWKPGNDTDLEVSYEVNRTDDVLYAGAGMDAPYSKNDSFRFKVSHALGEGFLRRLQAQLSHSTVAHLMDNYTHRNPTAAAMYLRAPTDSDTLTGNLSLEFSGAVDGQVGVDYQQNQRTAVRYRGTIGNVDMVQSYLWPDVTIRSSGFFGEIGLPLDDNFLKMGIRYDHIYAHAGKTTAIPNDPMGASARLGPNGLYTTYYGNTSDTHTEDNIGGFIHIERNFMNDQALAYVAASRTLRTGDATERYMASNNNASDDKRWVGNPFLDPEVHHQFDTGVRVNSSKWDLDIGLYYNDVTDYILRTRDHGRSGAGNATVYHNVDATLFGGEALFNYHWSDVLKSGTSLTYVHGENDTNNIPLAQIPPLELGLTTDYTGEKWDFGVKFRLVSRQMRVDDNAAVGSGLDVGKTPGFETVDIFGAWRPEKHWKLKFGIDNLFDRDFAEHLNRANAFDVTQVQIDEPGRSIWMTVSTEF
uniref:Iron complex outermembrane recepter protein n=1 Tax=Candidatus Kentrum sp. TUN TaxID=2126343 RepID=A0A450ZSE1_9GAMM|nr:MAG: iron complex outermembrane recepter protein [Candidatus Kentron sp. TUN]VFK63407.1 MAG: iron complex outermembrane recepter protein [Candidatus Kentron sp. TUN]